MSARIDAAIAAAKAEVDQWPPFVKAATAFRYTPVPADNLPEPNKSRVTDEMAAEGIDPDRLTSEQPRG